MLWVVGLKANCPPVGPGLIDGVPTVGTIDGESNAVSLESPLKNMNEISFYCSV